MNKRILTLLTLMLAMFMTVSAQVTKITGTVISSDDGEPIVGATVTVKGTKSMTVTDAEGKFTITHEIGGGAKKLSLHTSV